MEIQFPFFCNDALCKLLLHYFLLAAVGIEPCLPLEAGGRTAAAGETVTFWGRVLLSLCKFVGLVSLITPNVQVYPTSQKTGCMSRSGVA